MTAYAISIRSSFLSPLPSGQGMSAALFTIEPELRERPDILVELEKSPLRGWERFARDYSSLVFSAVARLVDDRDERVDAYLFAMEKLGERNGRRLRCYSGGSGDVRCSFESWLRLVVRNLTIDWIRSCHGRNTMPRSISSLSPVSRAVFRAIYWEGLSHGETVETIRTRDGVDLTLGDLSLHLTEIDARLSRTYRANTVRRLARRRYAPLSLDDESRDWVEGNMKGASGSIPPDRWVEIGEIRDAFRKALDLLEPEEREIARLRYVEEMTAKEIASAIGLGEYTALYPRLVRITDKLREEMRRLWKNHEV